MEKILLKGRAKFWKTKVETLRSKAEESNQRFCKNMESLLDEGLGILCSTETEKGSFVEIMRKEGTGKKAGIEILIRLSKTLEEEVDKKLKEIK